MFEQLVLTDTMVTILHRKYARLLAIEVSTICLSNLLKWGLANKKAGNCMFLRTMSFIKIRRVNHYVLLATRTCKVWHSVLFRICRSNRPHFKLDIDMVIPCWKTFSGILKVEGLLRLCVCRARLCPARSLKCESWWPSSTRRSSTTRYSRTSSSTWWPTGPTLRWTTSWPTRWRVRLDWCSLHYSHVRLSGTSSYKELVFILQS